MPDDIHDKVDVLIIGSGASGAEFGATSCRAPASIAS